jgi:Anti-sigma-K factor rskA/Sigma-70, region 4
MATFDQLPADQRAILELVVGRGQSYAELSTMLGMTPARVRELARDALGDLAPATAKRVDPDWRGQVADYLLGQQTGPEATATRGHLKRSEPARAWAFSLLDSLSHLYPNGSMPAIPESDGAEPEPLPAKEPERVTEPEPAAAPAAAAAPPPPPRSSGGLSPAAQSFVKRRRMIIGGVAGAAIIAIVVLLITGAFSGSDNKKSNTTATTGATGAAGATRILYEGVLKKVGNEKGDGVALVIQSGKNSPQLVVQAEALTPTGQKNAYEVWLYNSPTDAAALGAQFTDKNGGLQGRGPLPANFKDFKSVVVSRERVGTNPTKPSNIVLRGDLVAVPANAQSGATGATGATGP